MKGGGFWVKTVPPYALPGFLKPALPLLFLITSLWSAWAAEFDWQPVPGGRMAPLTLPAAGKTGFTLMTSQKTGLHFTNTLEDRVIMENNNFMQGAGVALGDLDGD